MEKTNQQNKNFKYEITFKKGNYTIAKSKRELLFYLLGFQIINIKKIDVV